MLTRLRTKEFMATALMVLMLFGLAATLWADEAPAPGAAAPAAAAAPVATAVAFTKEMADAIKDYKIAMDTMWVLVTAFLVFFMNLGFAMVESGLCRAKND